MVSTVATVTLTVNLPPPVSETGTVEDGYIAGSTVFFDANKNGILDPGEPSTVTAADGSFTLNVSFAFDRDGDGKIGPADGQLVALGGVDTFTGLLAAPMTALPGATIVSPLTTLVNSLAQQTGQSADDATDAAAQALGLPSGINLDTFDSIGQTLAGNSTGPQVAATAIKLANAVSLASSLVNGAGGSLSAAEVSALVYANLANTIDTSGTVGLSSAADLGTIIQSVADQASVQIDPTAVTGAANLIAAVNQHIDATPLSSAAGYLPQVVQAQVVAQGTIAPQLAQVAAGQADINTVLADHTGAALNAQVAAAKVGNLAPHPTISPVQLQDQNGAALSQGSASYGQSVTLTATISVAAGEALPTGMLTFLATLPNGTTSVLGTGTLDGTGTASFTTIPTQLGAGIYAIMAAYNGDAYHLSSTSQVTTGLTVTPANATITVTPYSVSYDGITYTATGTATGVGGVSLSGLTVSGTAHTNAGNYFSDGWTFHDVTGNYQDATGSVNDSIAKATATITVTPYSVTYDGTAHTGGSAVVSGAGIVTGSAVLSYTGDQIDAGSYTVTATYAGDANHTGSSNSATITIGKATSSVTTTGAAFTYDGTTHTGGSAVVSGAGIVTGSAVLSYTGDQIDAGSYTVIATYAGDANHTGSSNSATITIGKASSTTTATGAAFTYDGTTHTGGSALVSGAGIVTGSAVLSYTGDQIDAGSYTVTATYAGDANHTGSSNSASITIGKATSSVTTTGAAFTYDGTTHTGGSAVVTGRRRRYRQCSAQLHGRPNRRRLVHRDSHLRWRRQPHRQQQLRQHHHRQGNFLGDDDWRRLHLRRHDAHGRLGSGQRRRHCNGQRGAELHG